ncbi:LysR substrate-binding domain-containing protein [Actinomycetes bacterium KLBMP 9797]
MVHELGDLGRLLRELRRREARQRSGPELTYRDIAQKTGWSRGVIGAYFAGNVLPPIDRFDDLIRLLGATAAEQGVFASVRDVVEERRRHGTRSAGRSAGPTRRADHVRLAAFRTALSTLVPLAATALAASDPGVNLRVVEAEPAAATRLLSAGRVDVALLSTPADALAAADGDPRQRPLLYEPMYLVLPAGRPGDRLHDHAGQRWIAGPAGMDLMASCAEAGFTPDVAFTVDDPVAAQELVAAGLGVAVLYGLALAARRDPRVRTVRLPGPDRLVGAEVATRSIPPSVTTLLRCLAAAAAQLASRAAWTPLDTARPS